MLSGIITTIGKVADVSKHVTYVIESDFIKEIKVDQSVAHLVICLTL